MFQSTLPHGERQTFVSFRPDDTTSFNPRSRTGSDWAKTLVARMVQVSIHAPARGATRVQNAENKLATGFNPRSRTGSDERAFQCFGYASCFNPRSRTGSDLSDGKSGAECAVSIHAPARGATSVFLCEPEQTQVSIHAPARGATYCGPDWRGYRKFQSTLPHGERRQEMTELSPDISFNPRSRTGSDLSDGKSGAECAVSIHAPARGATRSRTPWDIERLFQSTLPHGERHLQPIHLAAPRRFNPRSRTGSDFRSQANGGAHELFQSTLPHGERRFGPAPATAFGAFQSTLPHGERPVHKSNQAACLLFQSTLPHGERLEARMGSRAEDMFQSTLPHGERPYATSIWFRAHVFQSTLPHGERLDLLNFFTIMPPFQSTLPHGERLAGHAGRL
ncbi:MAG: hypothetical protein SRB2_04349 [Desulfobacteraceae bacterium Eth-SRB2]|nr:MAG: hypothetical protein SRB2_04349 [Desulfobacteraceae bacterium Eth-SRB2]